MLSLFPHVLSYQLVAPILLRLTLGCILIIWAYPRFRDSHNPRLVIRGVIEAVLGILLVIGLFTQLAALISIIYFAILLIDKIKTKAFFTSGVNYYFLLFIISISLFLTGAGKIAFDMPL